MTEDLDVIARVKENAFAIVLDQSRKSPIAREFRIITERFINNRYAIFREGLGGNAATSKRKPTARSTRSSFIWTSWKKSLGGEVSRLRR